MTDGLKDDDDRVAQWCSLRILDDNWFYGNALSESKLKLTVEEWEYFDKVTNCEIILTKD